MRGRTTGGGGHHAGGWVMGAPCSGFKSWGGMHEGAGHRGAPCRGPGAWGYLPYREAMVDIRMGGTKQLRGPQLVYIWGGHNAGPQSVSSLPCHVLPHEHMWRGTRPQGVLFRAVVHGLTHMHTFGEEKCIRSWPLFILKLKLHGIDIL